MARSRRARITARSTPAGLAVRRHPVLLTLLIVLLLFVGLVIGGVVWAQSQINPGGHPGPKRGGPGPRRASRRRRSATSWPRPVSSTTPPSSASYVRIKGDGPLLPGTYSLPRNSSYRSAISALEAGPKLVTDTLRIPEGYTIRQIAAAVAALPNLHLSASRFLAAATSGEVRSPYEPPGVNNLEGLLFPDTYQVRQGESEVDDPGEAGRRVRRPGQPAGSDRRRGPPAYEPLPAGHRRLHRGARGQADRGPGAGGRA